MNGQLPLHQNLNTTTLLRNNKQFVKISIYNARNAIHEYTCTCLDSLLNVTMYKHIYLVIKYINSHLNYIPVKPLYVPMKSFNIWRDIDHLYVLLDQCTHEDILQQIRRI